MMFLRSRYNFWLFIKGGNEELEIDDSLSVPFQLLQKSEKNDLGIVIFELASKFFHL
jgi:hypothetical protein